MGIFIVWHQGVLNFKAKNFLLSQQQVTHGSLGMFSFSVVLCAPRCTGISTIRLFFIFLALINLLSPLRFVYLAAEVHVHTYKVSEGSFPCPLSALFLSHF